MNYMSRGEGALQVGSNPNGGKGPGVWRDETEKEAE